MGRRKLLKKKPKGFMGLIQSLAKSVKALAKRLGAVEKKLSPDSVEKKTPTEKPAGESIDSYEKQYLAFKKAANGRTDFGSIVVFTEKGSDVEKTETLKGPKEIEKFIKSAKKGKVTLIKQVK